MPDFDSWLRSRLHCPLCAWTLDVPTEDDDPAATAAAVLAAMDKVGISREPLECGTETLEEAMHRATFTQIAAGLQPAERAVRAHLETHPFEEWVAAAVRLYRLRESLDFLGDAEPPSDDRLSDAINCGGLSVNDVRWIQLAAGIIGALNRRRKSRSRLTSGQKQTDEGACPCRRRRNLTASTSLAGSPSGSLIS